MSSRAPRASQPASQATGPPPQLPAGQGGADPYPADLNKYLNSAQTSLLALIPD